MLIPLVQKNLKNSRILLYSFFLAIEIDRILLFPRDSKLFILIPKVVFVGFSRKSYIRCSS